MRWAHASEFLIFCEADRTRLLDAVAERRGGPVAIAADALDEVIEEVLGVGLVTRPLPGRLLGLCHYDRGCIYINSRLSEIALPNTDLVGLTHSTKAHELAHLRLPHHEAEIRAERRHAQPPDADQGAAEARREAEADAYAGVFLVPSWALWGMPAVADMLAAQEARHPLASEVLWAWVLGLAQHFQVTGSLMATRLVHLGLLEKEDRALHLAPLPMVTTVAC
jgi:hypothetical protein